jgi:stage II sporulation protein M
MLARLRSLPAPVLGWLPYVGLAVALELSLFTIGAAVGAAGTGSIIPVRRPGGPAPDISTMSLFAHNAGIALRSAFGIVTFGLYTTYVQALNGFVIGAAWADAAAVLGWGTATLALLPHGVIELPAFWLSAAVGFRWLHTVWKLTNGDRDRIGVPRLVAESLLLTGLILGMLFVAAVIEATVSVTLV